MEQGPVLEASGLPLGVVSAIAGQTGLDITIKGTQVTRLAAEFTCQLRRSWPSLPEQWMQLLASGILSSASGRRTDTSW